MPAAESVDERVEWWRDNGVESAFTSSHENAFTSSRENAFTSSHENAFAYSHENAFTSSHENAFTHTHENAFNHTHENAFTSSHENAFTHTHENAFNHSHENASTSNTQSFSSDAVTTHVDPHIVGQAIHQDSFLLSVPLYAHTDAHFAAWPPARSPEQIPQELFDRLDGWAEVTGVERGED